MTNIIFYLPTTYSKEYINITLKEINEETRTVRFLNHKNEQITAHGLPFIVIENAKEQ